MEEYVDKGILKAIGVSNFKEQELTYLTKHARIKPAVNQIESHPGNWNANLIKESFMLNVIPKSHNKEHQGQNLTIFDFNLTKEDYEIIAKL